MTWLSDKINGEKSRGKKQMEWAERLSKWARARRFIYKEKKMKLSVKTGLQPHCWRSLFLMGPTGLMTDPRTVFFCFFYQISLQTLVCGLQPVRQRGYKSTAPTQMCWNFFFFFFAQIRLHFFKKLALDQSLIKNQLQTSVSVLMRFSCSVVWRKISSKHRKMMMMIVGGGGGSTGV